MRERFLLAAVLGLLSAGLMAQTCDDLGYTERLGFVNDPNDLIINELSGKRIQAVATDDGEEWNEDHCSSGALYKVGAGTRIDPRAFRGTWGTNIANNGVTYDYTVGGTSSYVWTLWKDPATDALCWGDPTTSPQHQAIAEATAPAAIPSAAAADCAVP